MYWKCLFGLRGTDAGVSNPTKTGTAADYQPSNCSAGEHRSGDKDDTLALLSEGYPRDFCELTYRQGGKPWRQICEEMPSQRAGLFQDEAGEIVEAVAWRWALLNRHRVGSKLAE